MTPTHYAFSTDIPLAQTAQIQRKLLDLTYASVSPAQKLDIYWPDTGSGPYPVILAIHGGAFMCGDKADIQVKGMLEGVKHGYAVVSINYRMSFEATFPALVHDVKAAIRWVRANAQKYSLDPLRIAAWGGSAGVYQALMAGVSAGIPELEDLSLGNPEQPSNVQAVVAWFPPSDFSKMDEQLAELGLGPTPGQEHSAADSPESLILGGQLERIPERVKAANPATYLRPGLAPFLLQHGDQDPVVPCLQSVNFVEKARPLVGAVRLDILPGAGHGGPPFVEEENLARVFGWLKEKLG